MPATQEEYEVSIAISPEAEAKALQIPDFSARLERFIHDQFEWEQWRSRRAKSEFVSIVDEELREGAALRATEPDRASLFARLRSLTEKPSNGQ